MAIRALLVEDNDEWISMSITSALIDLAGYANYTDAARYIGRFLDEVYIHKRIHSSLGYLTPIDFESQWREPQAQQAPIH